MDTYELNRVMAEVCELSIFPVAMMMEDGQDKLWWAITNTESHADGEYVWDPCTDANQMELIKAKLREMGAEYVFEWDNDIVAHDVTLISKKGGMYYGGRHQSELIAFAIAVVAWWKERGK